MTEIHPRAKLGGPFFPDSGIRKLLHERAPDALNPDLEIPDLAAEFPESQNWLAIHLLNVAFRYPADTKTRAILLAMVRRASHALAHYSAARERTLRFARWDRCGPIPAGDYFGAIEGWENCLVQFQWLVEVVNKGMRPEEALYATGDRSAVERMCNMANCVKHPVRGAIQDLTPVWLEWEGIGALDGSRATYVEVADEIRETARLAREYTDPAAFAERIRREQDGLQ